MKNLFLLALIAITFITFYGCSKSSSSSGATTATSSQWTLKGTTYNGLATSYNTSSGLGILTSADAAGNSITVTFYSHPATNGTYTVSDAANSNDCSINVQTYANNASVIYSSTSKAGDNVNLIISGGKLKATFTNVTVSNGTTTTTTSGTVIQQ